jgi:CRP-like cAMP-binding protein
VAGSSLVVLGVAVVRYRRRHSLFAIEILEAGQIVFRQGDAGDCAYFIQSGAVDVVRGDGEKETVVARLSAGQYFGEMALLSNDPRNATIRAAARTKLAVLGKQNFLTLLNVLPSTREQILKTVQDRSAER